MTRTLRRLLREFDEAARQWGLMQEWGNGSAYTNAEKDYNEAKARLIKHLERPKPVERPNR